MTVVVLFPRAKGYSSNRKINFTYMQKRFFR